MNMNAPTAAVWVAIIIGLAAWNVGLDRIACYGWNARHACHVLESK